MRVQKLLVSIYCFSSIGFSQSINDIIPKSYIAYKTSEAIKIDGDESDSSWPKVEWTDAFLDIEGVKKPNYTTQVKMLWDDTYFYVLAKLQEPHVWANLKKRDTIIFYNNDFEIFIDPDGDSHNYYEIEINALNTVWDLFLTKPYREPDATVLNDWNATGLKSAVKVDGTLNNPNDIDKGWILEIAMPWSNFKTSYYHKNIPTDSFWRVNFSRVNWEFQITDGRYARKQDENGKFIPEYNWVWSPIGVINMHVPEKWGYVYFSSKEAGETDIFDIPQDEKIKWEMFQLYRAQKEYFSKNKEWSKTLDNIMKTVLIVENKTINPKLENHDKGWNITIKSPFSNKLLIIKEDGKFISE